MLAGGSIEIGDSCLLRRSTLIAYHSVTWFAVAPKAMPLTVRGEPVPAKAIVGRHYAAWAVVSLIVLITAGI
jgi:fumarate reductase subunit C